MFLFFNEFFTSRIFKCKDLINWPAGFYSFGYSAGFNSKFSAPIFFNESFTVISKKLIRPFISIGNKLINPTTIEASARFNVAISNVTNNYISNIATIAKAFENSFSTFADSNKSYWCNSVKFNSDNFAVVEFSHAFPINIYKNKQQYIIITNRGILCY